MTHNATRDDDPTNIPPTDADNTASLDADRGDSGHEDLGHSDPDHWTLADRDLTSRLFLGTGGMTSLDIMEKALVASESNVATVAMRRYQAGKADVFGMLRRHNVHILPNTAGCKSARDAVLTAKMARKRWIRTGSSSRLSPMTTLFCPMLSNLSMPRNSWLTTDSTCCRTRTTTPLLRAGW